MGNGNTFPLMFVHCALKSTPPHFVVKVMTIVVLSVLTQLPQGMGHWGPVGCPVTTLQRVLYSAHLRPDNHIVMMLLLMEIPMPNNPAVVQASAHAPHAPIPFPDELPSCSGRLANHLNT